MIRKPLCTRKINVFVNDSADTKTGQSYYSGEGTISAFDNEDRKVCVHFSSKGHVWFNRSQIEVRK